MGLNICLHKQDGTGHPHWDDGRFGHDRQFPSLINWEKTESLTNRYQEEYGFRPTNIPELRLALEQLDWDDKERYLHLLDLLEQEPTSYLYFSY